MSKPTAAEKPIARPDADPPRAHERGAALIVGLVMMLALTVLGISGMNMASLELTMAGNTQSQQLAFQAAESGIEMAISRPVNAGAPLIIEEDFDAEGSYSTRSVTEFDTITLPPDGAFSTDVAAYHFNTESVGSGPRNAVSRHEQSFYVIGPGSN